MIDTSSERAALRDLHGALIQASQLALHAAVDATADSVATTTLYRDQSFGTRNSLRKGVSVGSGFVSSGGATRFLEYGTPPHEIHAKGGATLAFQMNGAMMFRKMVHHPGTQPRPFMGAARAVGELAADYGADYFANYAIEKHNA